MVGVVDREWVDFVVGEMFIFIFNDRFCSFIKFFGYIIFFWKLKLVIWLLILFVMKKYYLINF